MVDAVRDFAGRARGRALDGPEAAGLTRSLIEAKVRSEPELQALYEEFTDEQARMHFGAEEPLEEPHLRAALRYFHAWRVRVLRERMGDRLASASILDVGDTDGLMLKHLGKDRLGFNIAPAAVENIRSNGVEGQLGDAHGLPFDDGEFDYVLCFETLEHVENPAQLLGELARVAKDRVFVSIPWVPRTNIHSRDNSINRGYGHVFEFSREDFGSLLTHTPLEIVWEDRCDILGPPSTVAERALATAARRAHIVGGMFHRFQFFELAHRT